MTRTIALALAVLVGEIAVPHIAAAQPADVEAARKHFEQAEAYFRTKAFDAAAAAYEAAYAAAAKAVLLFNVGLAWEQHGDAAAAVAAYDRYLAADPDGVKAVEARARRAALVAAIADAQKAGERTERAATLRREAAEHARTKRFDDAIAALRAAHELVPDPELDFQLGNTYLAAGDLVRAESAYRRYLEGEGTRRDDATARLREIEEARERAARPRERKSFVPAIVAFSTSGVALGVAVIFGKKAGSIDDELSSEIETGMPPIDTGDPRFDDGKNAALIANIGFGVAGVAALAGGYLAYRAWSANRTLPVTVAPVASEDGAGVAMEVVW